MTDVFRALLRHYSPAQVAARMDRWTRDFRRSTRRAPDAKVEKRIAERGDAAGTSAPDGDGMGRTPAPIPPGDAP